MNALRTSLLVLFAAYALPFAWKRFLTLMCIDTTNIAAKWTAPILKSYSFDDAEFFSADGAPADVAALRRDGMERLAKEFELGATGKIMEASLADGLSDIRFTDTNRVPFPFQRKVRSMLKVASIVNASDGPVLIDVDNRRTIDVSGSYGVNVAGYNTYKGFVERGWERVKDLGPNVLGPVHPVIGDVIGPLRKISGLDEVSFHMSGTEAVMCAVRLARFNTQRKLVVTFAGAYHGWWDGMQPGAGNERFTADVLSVKDMSPKSLAMIKARASEIAAVLISPLQGLNPGKPPPSDLVLLDAKMRETNDRIAAYNEWLHTLRQACIDYNIPLIFDEVYTGFRMAPGGAQEYYKVQADMVVYGKTLGGGMPVGVVCGKKELMHRFDSTRPLRVNYVIGTFSAAPITLGAMAEFLDWQAKPETHALYASAQAATDKFIMETNQLLVEEKLPMRVDSLTTVWTVLFKQPGRYHWMYQYYLRAEGLSLSWVGTGRCLFSLDFKPEDYKAVQDALIRAGRKMKADGWWWTGEGSEADLSKTISMRMGKEMAGSMLGMRK